MLSFRQRIFTGYLIVFIFFLSLIFPFSSRTVREITYRALSDRANELIEMMRELPTEEAILQRLKAKKSTIFFRVTVINNDQQVIFDSHTKGNPGLQIAKRYVISHPEILQAIKEGEGYYVGYSELLGQELSYMAKSFDFHGKTYVVRIAFPYKYIIELTRNFEIGFLGLVTAVLLLFSLMTWVIIHHLTNPIQQIIDAIRPYQEGTETTIPEIAIKAGVTGDEFLQLAQTLNSLSSRIRSHIDTLTTERNEKEAILQSLNEGVIAVDGKMCITYANNMALNLLHCASSLSVGSEFASIDNSNCLALLIACQQRQEPLSDTIQIKNNNEKLYLQIIAAPKGGEHGAVLVIQDQSPHHKMMEMRKDFVANASHELKTPITIILGFAEALHDNPDLPKSTVKEITYKIMANCQRMDVLIKDLLALSDIEQLSAHALVEVELCSLVEHCCHLVQEAFPTAKITVEKRAEEAYILGASNLIEMAVINLVENAAKYSQDPAEITITIDTVDNWAIMSVADQGFGIPEQDIENIFQRFYRADRARSKKIGGTGLGLSIVETIVDKHHGKISVKSLLGSGSTFTVYWPM